MLKYLFRYEVARMLFTGPGLFIMGLAALAFGGAVMWVIDHWWIPVGGYVLLAIANAALKARR